MEEISPRSLIRRVVIIICLTIVFATLTLPFAFRAAFGYILGAVGSGAWFLMLARDIRLGLGLSHQAARRRALTGHYLRFLFLGVYGLLVAWLLRPNLITFGLGLLAAQLGIYGGVLWESARKSKYFRGDDGEEG